MEVLLVACRMCCDGIGEYFDDLASGVGRGSVTYGVRSIVLAKALFSMDG